MTLDETLLQRLAEWRPLGEGKHTLTIPVEEAGWTVSLTADRCDELSSRLWELQVIRTSAPVAGERDLSGWAHQVAQRVVGLREPLRVVEIDTGRGEALLRSAEPSQRGSLRSYYEVLLRGGREALVRRYQADDLDGKRSQIAFALTHEVLAEFVANLTAP